MSVIWGVYKYYYVENQLMWQAVKYVFTVPAISSKQTLVYKTYDKLNYVLQGVM